MYNFSVHDDVYFVGFHELCAGLLAKNAHTGKDELTVVTILDPLFYGSQFSC